MTALDSSHLHDLALLSDEAFWEYARELARQSKTAVYPEEYLECLHSLSPGQGSRFIALKSLYDVVLPPHRFAVLPAVPRWMVGIVAWRSEAIAVIDLNAYFADVEPVRDGTLLVANYEGLPVGLLVPGVGMIRQKLSAGDQSTSSGATPDNALDDALVLDLLPMLADALRLIGTTTRYG